MPFLGNTPSNTFVSIVKQTITGNGGTSYALSYAVTSANDIDVFYNNIRQEPTVAYTASGTTITFSEAISSTDSVYILFNNQAIGTINPPNGSVGQNTLTFDAVTTNNIVNSAVTTAKLNDASVTRTKIGYAGAVLQVVSSEFTSEFTTSSSTLTDSGFSASITPSSTSNKILVFITASFLRVQGGASGSSNGGGIAIANGSGTILYDSMRDSGGVLDDWTELSGSMVRGATITKQMLHSPNTTSSYTYKIYCAQRNGGTLKLNYATSSKCVITLMEIAG